MKRTLSFAIIVALAACVLPSVHSQPDPTKQAAAAGGSGKNEGKAQPKADRSTDEAAIRANVALFVKAYNAGDAKAVAALFIPDGRIESKDGNESEGREAIAQTFGDLFKAMPKKQIEVFVDSIRFTGPDLAIEVGTTKESLSPNQPPEYDRYTVIHVKRDGKWQMALARDEEGPVATGHERLQPLAWLVGEWVDDGGSAVVFSSCRWSEDGNFLLQEFKLQLSGRDAMNVSQRIGWDPLAKRIRSWVFDSEGGFGESAWARDGDNWIIKATAVRPDGTAASSTNLLLPTGKDGYIWRSTDRIVADERQKPEEIKVARKPPLPKK
ncbi:MAG: SgcJ/EcaC family oxidoreductase [Gemmataceae bacterium]